MSVSERLILVIRLETENINVGKVERFCIFAVNTKINTLVSTKITAAINTKFDT